jgi:hypothetical protein
LLEARRAADVIALVRRQRTQLSRWLFRSARACLLTVAAILAFALFVKSVHPMPGWVAVVMLFALLGAPICGMFGAIARGVGAARFVPIRVESDYVQIGDVHVPRSAIVNGIHVPRRRAEELQLEIASGDVFRIEVPDAAAADKLLDDLGVDAEHRRFTVRWGRLGSRLAIGFVLAIAGSYGLMAAGELGRAVGIDKYGVIAILLMLFPMFIGWGVRRLGWHEATVGTDGIVARGPLRTRFFAFGDIASVSATRMRIELKMRNGTTEAIWAHPDDAAMRAALVQRIEKARAARGESAEARASLLARDGRSLRAWRDALVDQLRGAGGYRDAAVTRDDALRILENAELRAEQRIGAALALVGSGDAEATARVRVVAEASAAPRLRVALERVAASEDDDEAIEAAMRAG